MREDRGLVADLFGIQVVGDTDAPMLNARLVRVARRVELVDRYECRPTGHRDTLHGLLRHGRDGDVLDFDIALFDLTTDDLRDEVVGIVVRHELRGKIARQEVIVQRILLGDGVAADGVAIVRPISEVRPHLTLARTVVKIAVLDRLGATHLVDPDVAVRNGATRKG